MMKKWVFGIFILTIGICYAEGVIDNISKPNRYVGWACLSGSSNPVNVQIYADGVHIGSGGATLTREFVVREKCGSSHSNHGFDIAVKPSQKLLNGAVREVQAFLVYEDGSMMELDNSPVQMTFDDNLGKPKPTHYGDIVGRNLSYSWGGPLNYFGHIGIWDGENIIQATGSSNKDDTLRLESWESFSANPDGLWETVTPVAENIVQYYCMKEICNENDPYTSWPWVLPEYKHVSDLREMAAKRAYVSYLIGASYTKTSDFTPTQQGTKRYITGGCNPYYWWQPCTPTLYSLKPERGIYRCETFVLHSWIATDIRTESKYKFRQQGLSSVYASEGSVRRWHKHIESLRSSFWITTTPHGVYNKLQEWHTQ